MYIDATNVLVSMVEFTSDMHEGVAPKLSSDPSTPIPLSPYPPIPLPFFSVRFRLQLNRTASFYPFPCRFHVSLHVLEQLVPRLM